MIPYLNMYGFRENTLMKPKNYDVTISSNDHIITIEDGGSLLACLGLDLTDHILSLVGKDDEKFASVELPNATGIESVTYDKDKHTIIFIVNTTSGEKEEFTIDISDLIDIYEGGNGIEITKDEYNNNKVISIKINDDNKDILSADENGLAINLSEYVKSINIDELTQKIDNEIIRSTEKDSEIEYSISWLKTNKANKDTIPTKVSQLENDAQYVTLDYLDDNLSNFASKSDLASNTNTINNNISKVVEQLNNNIGVITNNLNNSILNETNRAISEEKRIENKINSIELDSFVTKDDLQETNSRINALSDTISTKVDKVDGKGLSSEDYTLDEKNKLASLENYNDSEIKEEIQTKATKEDVAMLNQVISDNVSTLVTAIHNLEIVDKALNDQKVDKVDGKSLSSEDYTLDEKNKLASLENYNDSEIKSEISSLSDLISEKVGQNVFNEKVAEIEDKIPSLVGYATEAWVEDKKYLTTHQSLDNYYTKKQTDDYFFSETEWGTASEKLNQTFDTCAKKDDLLPLLSKSVAEETYATKNDVANGLATKISANQAEDLINETLKVELLPYIKKTEVDSYVAPKIAEVKTDAISTSKSYADEKATEVANTIDSKVNVALTPVNEKITTNTNELHVLSVCNDGDEYDSEKAMTESGTGAFDETYRLLHKLLAGFDENDLSKLNDALHHLL